jgi:hypothetical protein
MADRPFPTYPPVLPCGAPVRLENVSFRPKAADLRDAAKPSAILG